MAAGPQERRTEFLRERGLDGDDDFYRAEPDPGEEHGGDDTPRDVPGPEDEERVDGAHNDQADDLRDP